MAKKVKLGSIKRYGVRYGRRNKEKVAALEKEHRGKHKCPYCNYVKVIRLAKGIWHCTKCDARFAGKAYTYEIAKKPVAVAPGPAEEPLEEEEVLEQEEQEEEKEAVEEKPAKKRQKKVESDIPEEIRPEENEAPAEEQEQGMNPESEVA